MRNIVRDFSGKYYPCKTHRHHLSQDIKPSNSRNSFSVVTFCPLFCFIASSLFFVCTANWHLPMFKGKNQSSKLLSCLSSSHSAYWGKQQNTPTHLAFSTKKSDTKENIDSGAKSKKCQWRDRQQTKAMKPTTLLFFHTHFRRWLLLFYCCFAMYARRTLVALRWCHY